MGPDVQQFREEGQRQCAPQELHARRAAGAGLVPDDALDGLHVPETPQLEGLLHVHQALAQGVLAPVAVRMAVDLHQHRYQFLAANIGLRPVPLDAVGRDRVALARQVAQELVVQGGRVQCRFQFGVDRRLVGEQSQHAGVLVAQQELHQPVLVGLEARGRAEEVAELDVLAWGERGEDGFRPTRSLIEEAVADTGYELDGD